MTWINGLDSGTSWVYPFIPFHKQSREVAFYENFFKNATFSPLKLAQSLASVGFAYPFAHRKKSGGELELQN
jgi:hypothetical protein